MSTVSSQNAAPQVGGPTMPTITTTNLTTSTPSQIPLREVPIRIPSTHLQTNSPNRRIIVPSPLPRVSTTSDGSLVQVLPGTTAPTKPVETVVQTDVRTNTSPNIVIPPQSSRQLSMMSTRPRPISPTIGINPTIIDDVGNNDVFKILVDNELVPLEQITITENDVKKVKYYQVHNTDGDIFYVKIDSDAGVTGVSKDFRTFREIKGMDIPLSYKVGLAKCANSVMCGVAFQCNGDVCFLRENNSPGQFSEKTYSETTDHIHQTLSNPKYPVAFPVVTLSEVIRDKNEVRRRVRMATKRIWDTIFRNTDESLDSTIKSLNNLTLSAIHFRELRKKFHQQIIRDTEDLRKYIDNYRRYVKMDSSIKDKFKSTVDNMFIRVKAFLKLINLTNAFNKLQDQFISIRENIDRINNTIAADMSQVSETIPPEEVERVAKQVSLS